ncbi:hypothetical protein [Nocardia sp. NPDC059239]|uniref:hypothetical protein n=1 Tax=Nocardia sp. NPDC059239 TaxID=3346785 RepID=UPI0036A14A5D
MHLVELAFEYPHRGTQAAGGVGHKFRAEKQQVDQHNNQDMPWAESACHSVIFNDCCALG